MGGGSVNGMLTDPPPHNYRCPMTFNADPPPKFDEPELGLTQFAMGWVCPENEGPNKENRR